MKNAAVVIAVALLGAIPQAWAQGTAESARPLTTWSVHSPDVMVMGRSVYLLSALTPPGPIVVRRVEALSTTGPVKGALANGDLIPCPVQYRIEVSDGLTKQEIPISNTLLNKHTNQTYGQRSTDVGVRGGKPHHGVAAAAGETNLPAGELFAHGAEHHDSVRSSGSFSRDAGRDI